MRDYLIKIKEDKKKFLLIFIIFIITLFIPYFEEDWMWSVEGFNNIFKNGMIVGNFFTITLTFNKLTQAVVMTLSLYFLIREICNLLKCDKNIVLFLIFTIPLSVCKSSLFWITGFANYVIASCFLIFCLKYLNKVEEKDKFSIFSFLFCGLLFFISSLVNIYLSIFLLLIAVMGNLFLIFRKKRIHYKLLGSLLGVLIAFSVITLKTGGSLFLDRSLWLSSFLSRFIDVSKNTFFIDYILIIGIVLSLFLYYKNNCKENKLINFLFVLQLFYLFYIICCRAFSNWNIIGRATEYFNFILCMIFLLVLLIQLFIFFRKKKEFTNILFWIIGLGVLLIAITWLKTIEKGSYFIIYLWLIILLLYMLDLSKWHAFKEINIILNVFLIFFAGFVLTIYGYVYFVNYKFEEYVLHFQETHQFLNYPILPYQNFLRDNIVPTNYEAYYKKKMGLREDLIFSQMPYSKWKKFVISSSSFKNSDTNFRGQFIVVPSYDGSNQNTHPCVIYSEEKLHGYHYWMAYTPWPNNQNKYENPSLAVSNDGINFFVPSEIKNPISGETGDKYSYYSDPYLFYDEDHFELWYRYNPYIYKGTVGTEANNLILRKTSLDGINWSTHDVILNKEDNQAYMSISVVHENGKYKIWYVNYNSFMYYRESKDLKKWSVPVLVQFEDFDKTIWHAEVKKINDSYELLLFHNSGKGNLYHSYSKDGIHFKNTKEIDTSYLPKDGKNRIYKSSFVYQNGKVNLYIPYNFWDKSSEWFIYFKQLKAEEFK